MHLPRLSARKIILFSKSFPGAAHHSTIRRLARKTAGKLDANARHDAVEVHWAPLAQQEEEPAACLYRSGGPGCGSSARRVMCSKRHCVSNFA